MNLAIIHLFRYNKNSCSKSYLIAIIIGIFLLGFSFQEWSWLYFSTQTAKSLFLGWGAVAFIIIGSFFGLYFERGIKFSFNLLDLLLGLLFLYSMIHMVWIRPVHPDKIFVLKWISLAILYFSFRIVDSKDFFILMLFLMVAATGQSIYGNLQLLGIFHSNHHLFKITGSFFNPGPFSGYLISIFPVALGVILVPKTALTNYLGQKLSVLLKNVSFVTFITILLILPAGSSRVAWLGLVIASLYLLVVSDKFKPVIQKLFNNSIKKWILNIIILFTIIATVTGLYLMKKNSADGRFLIWKITSNTIKDQPLWGHGIDKFKSYYMDYQANYFKNNPDTKESLVASDVIYPFNEPLRIASETGLIGLIILISIFFYALTNNKTGEEDGQFNLIVLARAGLISVLIFSFFSYPIDIVPIMVNVLLYLAIIGKSKRQVFLISLGLRKNLVRFPLLVVLLSIVFLTINLFYRLNQTYSEWNYAVLTYNMGDYISASREYEKIQPELKYNGNFLIYYGKALSMAGRSEEAIKVLEYSKNYLNNTILYTTLGDSYKETGQPLKAEAAYLHAAQMVPTRFYPKYLLAKLYDETSQHDKAIATAKELLNKEIKIDSKAIDEIKEEMEKIIQK
jgi:O-antigen polymerase